MKMEIPDDAEDMSSLLIGSISAVRDLLSAHNVIGGHTTEVSSGDFGYLLELIRQQAIRAHEIKFGERPPRPSNND